MNCPFINTCKEDVKFEEFEKKCKSPTHKFCPTYKKKTAGKKKPREWHQTI